MALWDSISFFAFRNSNSNIEKRRAKIIFLKFAIMMNIEKRKKFWLSFFDIHHDGECQNFFDFRFSIFIVMSNIKKILTIVFQYSTYSRMSIFFTFAFRYSSGWRMSKFFFLLFIFWYSSLNIEKRKAKIKLNYCCCASFSISIISVQIFKLTA